MRQGIDSGSARRAERRQRWLLWGVIVATTCPAFADVGFVIDPSGSHPGTREINACFYAQGSWWCLSRDSAVNYFFYRRELPTPETPGTVGGWTRQTQPVVEDRSSTTVDTWYNEVESVVHLLRARRERNGGCIYNEYRWERSGERWVKDLEVGDVALAGCSDKSRPDLIVDSTGQAFVATRSGGNLIVHHSKDRARTSWAVVILARGGPLDQNVPITSFEHRVDGPAIAVLHWKTPHQLSLYTHDDDRGDTAEDWTGENLFPEGTRIRYINDDHNCIRSLDDDLFVFFKDGGDDKLKFLSRLDGGDWGEVLSVSTCTMTDPTCAVDRSLQEVYGIYRCTDGDDTIRYVKTQTLGRNAFGNEQTVLKTPGIAFRAHQTVNVPATTDAAEGSGLLVTGGADLTGWYNLIGGRPVSAAGGAAREAERPSSDPPAERGSKGQE